MIPSFYLTNATLVLPDRLESNLTLVVRNGFISDITDDSSKYSALASVDAGGGYVVPSPIEIHIHGCGEYSFDQDDSEVVAKIADELSSHGTFCFVPGFMCNESIIQRVVKEIQSSKPLQSKIPGIYIEGPFVNPEKSGGIQPQYIRECDVEYLKRIIDISDGLLKLMTVAPELKGIEIIIDHLLKNNIIPCLGHSSCSINQARTISKLGQMSMTHLFNAMSGIDHKNPGLALLPFLDKSICFELNTDGVHIAPEMLQLCYQYLNKERMLLISDAVISAGKAYGRYSYAGKPVVSDEKGVRYEESGIRIGSNGLVLDCVKNFMAVTGAMLVESIRMATLNPCRILGIDKERGSIMIGKKAELSILDKNVSMMKNLSA